MNHCCMTFQTSSGGAEGAPQLLQQEREELVHAVEVRGEEDDGDDGDDGRVPDLHGRRPARPAQLGPHVADELAHAVKESVAAVLGLGALAARGAPLRPFAEPRHARGRARRRPRQVVGLVMARSHLFVLSLRHLTYKLPTGLRRGRTGVTGFEPVLSVLETDVLTVDTIPL